MQSINQILAVFQERANKFHADSHELNKKYNNLSIARISVFIGATVLLIYFANERDFLFVTLIALLFPFIFGFLLKLHQKIAYNRAHALYLNTINNAEIEKLNGNLRNFDSGERFIDEQHNYSIDLDIFGKNSLFQLINRCTTETAKSLLAQWLSHSASTEEVQERQSAVRELAPLVDWRQDFQASGMHYEDKESNVKSLLQWLASPLYFQSRKGYQYAAYIMPLITLLAIIFYFLGEVHYLFPLLAILINVYSMRKAVPMATNTQEQTYQSIKSLKAYQALIGKIEVHEFSADKLKTIKRRFSHEGFSAMAEIKRLETILDWLNSRNNAFYFLFNVVFLIDIHLLLQAERWKMKTKVDISHWFDAISEMEVLISLAGLSYANPEYVFPEITAASHFYEGTSLGHPLLKKESRITNDFSFSGKGSVIVLTGSNMSGKSTFLRTLGTNAVLALMGSVACAKSLKLGNFKVFTSMRTVDSLEESVSSFYAELQRLQQLLNTITDEQPVFFMLDEILKGTNSHDRHKGAAALIRQLNKKNALGIVSTHDLELGSLAEEKENISNYSFTSSIKGDEIIFDYKLHPGICQSFNASKLMEKMGIEIDRRG